MKKRFRRSAVSVVLAVALLLSQHSMLAFAADGDLSLDASNEPPVQVAQVDPDSKDQEKLEEKPEEKLEENPEEKPEEKLEEKLEEKPEEKPIDGEEQKNDDQQETAGSDEVSADDGGNKEKETVAQQPAVSAVSTAAPVALAAAAPGNGKGNTDDTTHSTLNLQVKNGVSIQWKNMDDTPIESPPSVTFENNSTIVCACKFGNTEHTKCRIDMATLLKALELDQYLNAYTVELKITSNAGGGEDKFTGKIDTDYIEWDNDGKPQSLFLDGITFTKNTPDPVEPDPEDPNTIPEGWAKKINVEVECEDDDDDGTCEHCGGTNIHDHGDDDDEDGECICDDDDKKYSLLAKDEGTLYTTNWNKDTQTLTVTFDASHGTAWAGKFHDDVSTGENGCQCGSHFFCSYDDDEDDDNEHQQSVTVILKYEDGKWSVEQSGTTVDTDDNGNAKVEIDVHCNGDSKPEEPTKPTKPNINTLVNVLVKCITLPDDHTESETMALVDETYTSTWNDETTPTEVTVTLTTPQSYVDDYNTSENAGSKKHTLVDGEYKVTLEWKNIAGEGEKANFCWTVDNKEVTADSPATITVEAKCTEEKNPEKPTVADLDPLGAVKVVCINEAAKHGEKVFNFKDVDNDNYNNSYYEVTEPVKDETTGTWTSSVTVKHQPYADRFVNYYIFPSKEHKMLTEETQTIINLVWKPEANAGNGAWEKAGTGEEIVEGEPLVTIKVICGLPKPDLTNVKARLVCTNKEEHSTNVISLNNLAESTYYTVEVDSDTKTATVSITDEQVQTWITNNQIIGKPEHLRTETPVNEVSLKYDETKGWSVDGTDTIIIPVVCTEPHEPTPGEVEPLFASAVTVFCRNTTVNHPSRTYAITNDLFTIGEVYPEASITKAAEADYFADVTIMANDGTTFFNQYYAETGHTLTDKQGNISKTIVKLKYDSEKKDWKVDGTAPSFQLSVTCTTGGTDPTPDPDPDPTPTPDPDPTPTPTPTPRTIEDEPVPLAELPDDVVDDTVTIEDEEVPLAELPDDLITIEDEEVPLKGNPFTGDSLPFAAMAAAAISFCGILAFGRRKK